MLAAFAGPVSPRESLTESAVRIAIDMPEAREAGQDTWGAVRVLAAGTRLRVTLRNRTFKEGRLSSVENDRIVLLSPANVPMDIHRADVAEVHQRARISWIGGGVGVAAGALAGLYSAWSLGWIRCPSGCPGKRLLIPASLIGLPIAGGYAGSRLHARWVRVYRG